MKDLLTKKEASNVLLELLGENEPIIITKKTKVLLDSIRICLEAEKLDLDLWGKNLQKIKPVFDKCENPGGNASKEDIENYKIYRETLAKSKAYISL